MAIYKYMSARNGLRYLQSWRLKYSLPREFNDPFELLPSMTERQAVAALLSMRRDDGTLSADANAIAAQNRGIKERVQQLFDEFYGALCFSRTRKHLLMWAHYADCHRGMLLEFDEHHSCFERQHHQSEFIGRLHAVHYSDERSTLQRLDVDTVRRIFLTKSLEWAHEQEVRLFWPIDRADSQADGNFFYQIPPTALRRIVLGARCSDELMRGVQEALKSANVPADIEVHKAQLRDGEYAVDYGPASS